MEGTLEGVQIAMCMRLKPLTGEMNNIDHIFTGYRSAGKPWVFRSSHAPCTQTPSQDNALKHHKNCLVCKWCLDRWCISSGSCINDSTPKNIAL